MAPRALIVFEHDSELGSAPSHKLLEGVIVKLKNGVAVPRCFSDYDVIIPEELIQFCKEKNITLIRRI